MLLLQSCLEADELGELEFCSSFIAIFRSTSLDDIYFQGDDNKKKLKKNYYENHVDPHIQNKQPLVRDYFNFKVDHVC